MRESEIVESNERFSEAWKLYARLSPGGEVFDRDGLSFANANQPWSFMNVATLNRSVIHKSDLRCRARAAVDYFGVGNNPWFLVVSENWFGPGASQVLGEVGLVCKLSLKGMVAERLAPPLRSLPNVEVRRIDRQATRYALADLNADCYGVPKEWGRLAVGSPALWQVVFGTIAYLGDVPVSGTLAFPIGNALYVGWVATARAYRGKGFAELVIRRCLEDARKATGLERTVLHATEDGWPVYKRMGYRSVIDFPLYGPA